VFTTIKREAIEAGELPEIFNRDLVHSMVVVGITHPVFIDALRLCAKPVVLVSGGSQGDTGFDCVLNDDFQGMEQVIRHLVGLGHREIGLIGGRLDHVSNLERYRAFRIFMDEVAGVYNPVLVHVKYPDASITDGRNACTALLKSGEKFTALVCMTDDMAYGAFEVLKQRGLRIPGDMAVAGFNDLSLSAHTVPPLTSVQVCCEELGAAAHQVVRTRLGSADIKHAMRLMVGTRLVVRNSTDPKLSHAARIAGTAGAS
jgi:LacI family transcriptional regulator